MGYDSTSFVFYGIQVEKIDWDTYDQLQHKLLGTPYDIRSTGSQAIGPIHHFICLRDSYLKISDNRYNHIAHQSLSDFSQSLDLINKGLEINTTMMNLIRDNDLVPLSTYPQWFAGAYGG